MFSVMTMLRLRLLVIHECWMVSIEAFCVQSRINAHHSYVIWYCMEFSAEAGFCLQLLNWFSPSSGWRY